MSSMTVEQKNRFTELLGKEPSDVLHWDDLPIEIKRILVFAAGIPMHFCFMSWACFGDIDKAYLNKAAAEFVSWAEAMSEKLKAQTGASGLAA